MKLVLTLILASSLLLSAAPADAPKMTDTAKADLYRAYFLRDQANDRLQRATQEAEAAEKNWVDTVKKYSVDGFNINLNAGTYEPIVKDAPKK